MYKILLSTAILLLLLMLGLNQGFSDERNDNSPVILNESQKADQKEGVLSKDLPSIKGLVRSFVIVIGLIVIFFVFLKWRYGFSRGIKGNKKYIQVLEYSMLGPKRYLYLVKVLDKLLVVGATNDGMSLLCEMNEAEKKELLEGSIAAGEGFSGLIKKITGKAEDRRPRLEI